MLPATDTCGEPYTDDEHDEFDEMHEAETSEDARDDIGEPKGSERGRCTGSGKFASGENDRSGEIEESEESDETDESAAIAPVLIGCCIVKRMRALSRRRRPAVTATRTVAARRSAGQHIS